MTAPRVQWEKLGLSFCQMLPHLEQGGVQNQGFRTTQCGRRGGGEQQLESQRKNEATESFEQEAPVRLTSWPSPRSRQLGTHQLRQDSLGMRWVGGQS